MESKMFSLFWYGIFTHKKRMTLKMCWNVQCKPIWSLHNEVQCRISAKNTHSFNIWFQRKHSDKMKWTKCENNIRYSPKRLKTDKLFIPRTISPSDLYTTTCSKIGQIVPKSAMLWMSQHCTIIGKKCMASFHTNKRVNSISDNTENFFKK